jgi:hypothetical protein
LLALRARSSLFAEMFPALLPEARDFSILTQNLYCWRVISGGTNFANLGKGDAGDLRRQPASPSGGEQKFIVFAAVERKFQV